MIFGGGTFIVPPLRVEKVFFDTPENVEKATKPSEPRSSAYRGTAECGSRRKAKLIIINGFELMPIKNRKKNFKSQKDPFVKNAVLWRFGEFFDSRRRHVYRTAALLCPICIV